MTKKSLWILAVMMMWTIAPSVTIGAELETVAGMGAAAIFFFLSRSQVAPRYRPALLISGIVVAVVSAGVSEENSHSSKGGGGTSPVMRS